jgi:hypothetical protein
MALYKVNPLKFIEDTLGDMVMNEQIRTVTQKCHHCGYPMRYPLMVRSDDVERMELLIEMTIKVMMEMGIYQAAIAGMLAEVKTQCISEMLARQAKREGGDK